MRKVVYRPRASLDLELVVLYYGEVLGQPMAARKAYEGIRKSIALLCETPQMGKLFHDLRLEGTQYRWFLSGQYRIFYTYDENTLTIWRIIHTRRDMDDYDLIEWNNQ